ncbi:hypothetical protein [Stenotrophomonas maltophilia]|uniref:hypothetical protein n=1 Tax=Stenotrophomonas maltophilia TaxID=40324 RepID=UPI002ACED4F6|nr:hypothetical protein [Stenotrophomonas maltophilia]
MIISLLCPAYAKSQAFPVTGLGQCVDFISAASTTLTSQIQAHVGVRAYGLPPSYDPLTAKILVPPYSCDSNDWPGLYKTVGYLSHELGHHEAGVPNIDAPITKDQYVERNCVWEAKAVVNNAVVSDQIRVASEGFVEVPLISENSAKLWSMWSGGESLVDIGKVFCDNNHVASGKTYTKQHEDYYDANYPW